MRIPSAVVMYKRLSHKTYSGSWDWYAAEFATLGVIVVVDRPDQQGESGNYMKIRTTVDVSLFAYRNKISLDLIQGASKDNT